MSYDFNIAIVGVQCRPRGNESYEGNVRFFDGKKVHAGI
jgi:hypothetical protein